MFSDLIRRMDQHINIIMRSILLVPTLSFGNAAQSTTEMFTVVELWREVAAFYFKVSLKIKMFLSTYIANVRFAMYNSWKNSCRKELTTQQVPDMK